MPKEVRFTGNGALANSWHAPALMTVENSSRLLGDFRRRACGTQAFPL